jgi:hypothetical protein
MTGSEGMKPCTKCGEVKLITQFHFLTGPVEPGEERRRRSDCKDCHRQTMVKYRERRVATEGEAYLRPERERVRNYASGPQAERRKAVERARHTALRALKDRHPNEYAELEAEFKRLEGVS